jgi:hypothetical protein
MDPDSSYEISSWLSLQLERLQVAQNLSVSGIDNERAISELESIVRGYVERAKKGASSR